MESQKLLKRKRNRENDRDENEIKKKIRFYIFTILNYPKKYYRIIIICTILFIIGLKLYKTKKNKNDLSKGKEQLINNIIYTINISNISNNTNNNKINIRNNNIRNIRNNSIEKKEEINNEEEITFEEEETIENKKEEKIINMTNVLETINKYIYNCLNDILIDGIKISSKNPEITSIIASYNSAKTIKASIRSIQNQKMSDLEIVIVDDGSTDKSLNIIENMQKEDPRIKIIKNKENMGPLYSKSLGALHSNGKYIMYLDSDDLFINENIFNICYEEAEKKNIDIIEFSGIRSVKKYLNISKKPRVPLYLRFKENNLVVKQPELSTFIYPKYFNKITKLIDGYLWGKCIRTIIYRKALDTLGKDVYEQKLFYGDDRIVNFILFRVANSFKYIQEYGIIYYSTSNSILNSNKKIRNCHDELINIMNIFNFTKNSSDAEIAAFELKDRWKRLIKPGLNNENTNYARNLIKQMLKCKYINRNNKKYIYTLWINRNNKKKKK